MTPLKAETVETYNKSAVGLAKKFDDQGARIQDIDYVFSFIQKENPFVFEIGCGNGRDAKEIYKRTNKYLGMDISENLLSLAREKVPGAQFILGDIETFEPPEHINVTFAFASLIHVTKESFKEIMEKLFQKTSPDGLVFVSLKYSDTYVQKTKNDEFGTRTYWHYSQSDVQEVASGFTVVHTSIQDIRGQIWIEVLYQKK